MNFRTLLSVFALAVCCVAVPFAGLAQDPGAESGPVGPTVRSIEIQYAGASSVSKEKILANMRTRVGRPYSDQVVAEDIRNLYNTGNIANVRIYGQLVNANDRNSGVKVIVVLLPKTQVTEVRLEGISQIKESKVRREISTKPGSTLSEASLEQDRQKIESLYSARGFTEVEVKYTSKTNDAAGTSTVLFSVTEGVKSKIRNVYFVGNATIKKSEIAKVVKTRHKGLLNIFTDDGKLNPELLQADVGAIRDLYHSKGYMDAEVSSPAIQREGTNVDVTFQITEGAQYRVGKVTSIGNHVFTQDEINKVTKLRTGDIYSPQKVREDIKAVQDLYGARGYVDFGLGQNASPGPGRTYDVTYTYDEGVQSYVEHINITGNTRTKDKVIRRELALHPGDVYNTVLANATKARLENLNYFYTAREAAGSGHQGVSLYPSDTLVPGRKDLNVLVEEKRTGQFNFGAGFSSIDNLLGFAEITQSNFDIMRWPYFTGGGQKFRLRLQYGTQRKDFILALTEPYFLDREVSVGGELFYNDASFLSDIYDERRYGFDITARKRLSQFVSLRTQYRLENITIHNVNNDASDIIRAEEGSRTKSQISSSILFDNRDSLLLTRSGQKIEFSANIAGGFLGADTQDYGFDLEASKYILLPYDTILTLNGEVAFVDTWGSGDRVPIYDRLFLGGANNLRGFKFRDVGPKDEHGEAIGGKSLARFTVEYTFPIVEKVRGAVFYDVGFVNSGSYDFSTDNVNSDVGIGLRLDLPIGPVRIDYGFPVQKDDNTGSGGRFNFNIGYQF